MVEYKACCKLCCRFLVLKTVYVCIVADRGVEVNLSVLVHFHYYVGKYNLAQGCGLENCRFWSSLTCGNFYGVIEIGVFNLVREFFTVEIALQLYKGNLSLYDNLFYGILIRVCLRGATCTHAPYYAQYAEYCFLKRCVFHRLTV